MKVWHGEVIRRYWSGESPALIAEMMGHGVQKIRSIISDAGGPLPRNRIDPERWDRMVSAVEDGWPQQDIVAEFRISPELLRRLFPDRVWKRGRGSTMTRRLAEL